MLGHGMACMEYMSGACHVMACHGIHVGGLSCYRAWHSTHGLHVGDCHVMACMEYMSGIVMSPCIYVAMPCPVVQKLSRAAKHFRTLAGLVLLTCLQYVCRRSRVGTAMMLYCNPAATPPRHSAQQAQQAFMESWVDVLILTILRVSGIIK